MKKPMPPQKRSSPPEKQATSSQSVVKPVDPAQKKVEEQPAVEWGDRISSGKAIARGGKADGFVPGAMPSR